MKNKKITRKITQGVYVLTTEGGGCIVDAVSKISAGENPLIAVSVMKKNYTHKLLEKNTQFALSVLGINTNGKIIETFGLNSTKDIDKFAEIEWENVNNSKIIKDSLGYMICEIVDKIENDTHTLFIGRLKEADVFKEEEAMSYNYYQEHKETLIKVTSEKGHTAWICSVCGYVYYGETLEENFKCPVCGVDKTYFQKQ